MYSLWAELSSYSIPEIVAVLASLLYIVLAARENRFCWPAAFVGSAIFSVLFWQYQLLMDSALNAYYTAMAVYGWVVWNRRTHSNPTSIRYWPVKNHLLAIAAVGLLTLCSGYWLSHYSNASFPYLDSFTTWVGLLATWMIAQKILENWLYWIVADVVAVYLYINKDLHFTVALFIIYIITSIYGYINWKKQLTQQVNDF